MLTRTRKNRPESAHDTNGRLKAQETKTPGNLLYSALSKPADVGEEARLHSSRCPNPAGKHPNEWVEAIEQKGEVSAEGARLVGAYQRGLFGSTAADPRQWALLRTSMKF